MECVPCDGPATHPGCVPASQTLILINPACPFSCALEKGGALGLPVLLLPRSELSSCVSTKRHRSLDLFPFLKSVSAESDAISLPNLYYLSPSVPHELAEKTRSWVKVHSDAPCWAGFSARCKCSLNIMNKAGTCTTAFIQKRFFSGRKVRGNQSHYRWWCVMEATKTCWW